MNLQSLSDSILEQKLAECAHHERRALAAFLHHVGEFDSRKLFQKRGYSSLFEYLTIALRYTNGSAQRRIEAARLLRVAPDVAEKIEDGRLQLSNVGELARAIKQKEAESKRPVSDAQKRELLGIIENLTVPEAQLQIAQALDLKLKPVERRTIQKDESVNLQITLSKDQYERLLQCRDLASHKLTQNGDAGLAATITYVCEHFIKAKTMIRTPSATTERAAEVTSTVEVDGAVGIDANKTVTPRMRKILLAKYKHCQHVDPVTNQRCQSRFLLQVDHLKPRWAGGDHTLENLTLLCAFHNQEKYRQQSFTKPSG